jgi:hypothetical protein
MTEAERRAFLANGTRTGKLGTVRADGRRNAVPGELLVRLRTTRIVSEAGVAD